MSDIFLILAQIEGGSDGQSGSILFGLNWNEVIASVLGLLGAGVTAWWAFKTKKTISVEEQQKSFYADIIKEYAALRELYNSLQSKMVMLQAEIHQLRKDLSFYEENHLASNSRAMIKNILNSSPLPEWINDIGSNRWYVNNAYSQYFNVDKQDFWTPINILARYPDTENLKHINNDLSVVAIGTVVEFEEEYNKDIMNPKSKYKMKAIVKKYPFCIGDNNYIYGKLVEVLEDNIPVEK